MGVSFFAVDDFIDKLAVDDNTLRNLIEFVGDTKLQDRLFGQDSTEEILESFMNKELTPILKTMIISN